MKEFALNALCFVLGIIMIALIPINIYASQKYERWKVLWDHEQAERKRKRDMEEIIEAVRKELGK